MSTMTEYQTLLLEHVPRPIRTEAAYRRALKLIERLMKPQLGRAESELVELWATLIEQYETQRFPTPRLTPAARLAELIAAREVSQADVARATGIPRATINNIVAGRRGASKQNAARLAEYFGVPVEGFL